MLNESAAYQNFAVRLGSCRPPAPRLNDTADRAWVERISQAGRRIEPGDVIARLSADAIRSG